MLDLYKRREHKYHRIVDMRRKERHEEVNDFQSGNIDIRWTHIFMKFMGEGGGHKNRSNTRWRRRRPCRKNRKNFTHALSRPCILYLVVRARDPTKPISRKQ